MTKGNGVTHFTELHRTLHKNFLIWRWPSLSPFYAIKRQKAPARPELFDIYRSFWSPDTASLALLTTSSTMSGWVLAKLPSIY